MSEPRVPNITKELIEYLEFSYPRHDDESILAGANSSELQLANFNRRLGRDRVIERLKMLLEKQVISGGMA